MVFYVAPCVTVEKNKLLSELAAPKTAVLGTWALAHKPADFRTSMVPNYTLASEVLYTFPAVFFFFFSLFFNMKLLFEKF